MTDGTVNTGAASGTERRLPYKVFLLSALGISIALGVFRAILLNGFIDAQTGLYNNQTLGTVFFVLLAVLIAGCVCTRFYALKHPAARPIRNETVTAAFSATMCGMSFATVAVIEIISEVRNHSALTAYRDHHPAALFFFAFELLLIIPSSVYFWHLCIDGAKTPVTDKKETILPVFPALYLGVRIVRIFINTENQINASERSFLLLTLAVMMMFFISEARFYVSTRPNDETDTHAKRFARFYVYALLSMVLTVCIVIPYGVVSAFSVNRPDDLIYYVLGLCLGLHATLRIVSF